MTHGGPPLRHAGDESADIATEAHKIVAGMSAYTRQRMRALLGDAFNVLDNKDVVCPMYIPPCGVYLRLSELRGLLAELNHENSASHDGSYQRQPGAPQAESCPQSVQGCDFCV